MAGTSEDPKPAESQASPSPPPSTEDESKKWGTHIMGAPAAPNEHPDNQKAAFWNAAAQQQIYHHPYVQYSPVDHRPSTNPFEPVVHAFNSWSNKAESIARNIWHNRKWIRCWIGIRVFVLFCFSVDLGILELKLCSENWAVDVGGGLGEIELDGKGNNGRGIWVSV